MDEFTSKFYCISLKDRPDRRKRIIKRWDHHKLLSHLLFIDAVTKDSSLVQYYGKGYFHNSYDIDQQKGEAGCFASHIKAIRIFLETSDESSRGAIICEDDCLLRNDFKEKYDKLFANLPDEATLVTLGYYVGHWIGFNWCGKDTSMENLCNIVSDHVWSTTMYWISREYAKDVLARYDKPLVHLEGHKTAELITRFSEGYISYPPLVIEDCMDSNIRSDEGMPLHITMMRPWGYCNYWDTEDNKEDSPLYEGPKLSHITENKINVLELLTQKGENMVEYKLEGEFMEAKEELHVSFSQIKSDDASEDMIAALLISDVENASTSKG